MTDNAGITETSILRNWDERSGVRSKNRVIVSELCAGKTLFPRALAPIAEHPLVLMQGPALQREILNQRLFLYLDFTTALEQDIVNPVLADLGKDALGVGLPHSLRLDAHRIYVDEAYHALAAVDMAIQLSDLTGSPYNRFVQHAFAGVLHAASIDLEPADRALVAVAAATVSETLISGTLAVIPRDESVATEVRQSVQHHADDERTHHAYFSRLHEFLWPRLSRRQKELVAPLYARFIMEFLTPDRQNLAFALVHAGMADRSARSVVEETYEEINLKPSIVEASRATVKLLRRTGVLELPEAEDTLSLLGLSAA